MFTPKETKEVLDDLAGTLRNLERAYILDEHEGLKSSGHYQISSALQDILRNLIYIVDIGLAPERAPMMEQPRLPILIYQDTEEVCSP